MIGRDPHEEEHNIQFARTRQRRREALDSLQLILMRVRVNYWFSWRLLIAMLQIFFLHFFFLHSASRWLVSSEQCRRRRDGQIFLHARPMVLVLQELLEKRAERVEKIWIFFTESTLKHLRRVGRWIHTIIIFLLNEKFLLIHETIFSSSFRFNAESRKTIS